MVGPTALEKRLVRVFWKVSKGREALLYNAEKPRDIILLFN